MVSAARLTKFDAVVATVQLSLDVMMRWVRTWVGGD